MALEIEHEESKTVTEKQAWRVLVSETNTGSLLNIDSTAVPRELLIKAAAEVLRLLSEAEKVEALGEPIARTLLDVENERDEAIARAEKAEEQLAGAELWRHDSVKRAERAEAEAAAWRKVWAPSWKALRNEPRKTNNPPLHEVIQQVVQERDKLRELVEVLRPVFEACDQHACAQLKATGADRYLYAARALAELDSEQKGGPDAESGNPFGGLENVRHDKPESTGGDETARSWLELVDEERERDA